MKKIIAIIRLLWAKNYILLTKGRKPDEWYSMWDIKSFKGTESEYLTYVLEWLNHEMFARELEFEYKTNRIKTND